MAARDPVPHWRLRVHPAAELEPRYEQAAVGESVKTPISPFDYVCSGDIVENIRLGPNFGKRGLVVRVAGFGNPEVRYDGDTRSSFKRRRCFAVLGEAFKLRSLPDCIVEEEVERLRELQEMDAESESD